MEKSSKYAVFHNRIQSSFFSRYGLAIASSLGVLYLLELLDRFAGYYFFTFPLAAVALLTIFLGAGPGLLLSIIVGVCAWYFYQAPRNSFRLDNWESVRLAGYFLTSFIIVFLISRLERTRRKLAASLHEKEILLRELYHRTKNNMQVISSLISMQASRSDKEGLNDFVQDTNNRIRAMSLVQEKLYRSGDLSNLQLKEYIEGLAQAILKSYKAESKGIEVHVEAEEDLSCQMEIAITCGLIMNELISNSLKYAFPDGKNGNVLIRVSRNDGCLQFEYRDDGIGLLENFERIKEKSLGLRLVTNLIRRFSGELEVTNKNGLAYRFSLKVKE